MKVFPLFRVTGAVSCVDVGNAGWQDISTVVAAARSRVRIDNYRPFQTSAVLYLSAAKRPPRPGHGGQRRGDRTSHRAHVPAWPMPATATG